jgi:hypothetical protein
MTKEDLEKKFTETLRTMETDFETAKQTHDRDTLSNIRWYGVENSEKADKAHFQP